MSKLGIALMIVSGGAGTPMCWNEGPWRGKVVDVRRYLRVIPQQTADSMPFVLWMSFTETGCMLTLVRMVAGRDDDYKSMWIHVPSDMFITGEQLQGVIVSLAGLIRGNDVSTGAINEIATVEYPERPIGEIYVPSTAAPDMSLALRRSEVIYKLAEILDQPVRWQKYYKDFRLIYLVSPNVTIAGCADLTDRKLEPRIMVAAPSVAFIQEKFGADATLSDSRGNQLPPVFFAEPGQEFRLQVCRSGFETATVSLYAEAEGKPLSFAGAHRWQVRVTLSQFSIVDKDRNPITAKPSITVNGRPLDSAGLTMYEEEARDADVTVSAKGYLTSRERLDLLQSRYNVRLIPDPEAVRAAREAAAAEDLRKAMRKESKRKGKVSWTDWIIGFVTGAVLVGAAWAIVALCIGDAGHTTEVTELPTAGTTENSTGTVDEEMLAQLVQAGVYLDGHDVWEKAQMDSIPALTGFYDALNRYEFKTIYADEAGLAKASKKFSALRDKVNNIPEGALSGEYSGDGKITVEGYMKKLGSVQIPDPQAPEDAKQQTAPESKNGNVQP